MIAAAPRALPRVRRQDWMPIVWLTAALTLLALQVGQGVSFEFALGSFCYIALTYATIAALGGIRTLFGAVIFYFSLQHVFVAMFAKGFLGEPPEARLVDPLFTILVYNAGMASLLVGALISRKFRLTRRPAFPAKDSAEFLVRLSLAVTVLMLSRGMILTLFSSNADSGTYNTGGVFGPLRQMAFLEPFAVVVGTAATVTLSKGRSLFSWMNGVPLGFLFMGGVIGAGRQGMVGPVVIMFLTAIAFDFRLRWKHVLTVAAGVYVAQYILFPYALLARSFVRGSDINANIAKAADLFVEVVSNPGKYSESSQAKKVVLTPEAALQRYYPQPRSTLERFAIIKTTDGIVAAANQRGFTGMLTIDVAFRSVLPSFIVGEKGALRSTGNILAHRVKGMVGDQDYVTAITTGQFADEYTAYGWPGLLILPGLLLLGMSLTFRVAVDPHLKRNIFALGILLNCMWVYSEGTIASLFVLGVLTPVVVIVTYGLCLATSKLLEFAYLRRRRPGAFAPATETAVARQAP